MLTGILNKTVLCDGLGMVINNSSANFVERLFTGLPSPCMYSQLVYGRILH